MAETYVELMSGWRINDDGTLRADFQTMPGPDEDDRNFDTVVVGTVALVIDPARSSVQFPLNTTE